MNFTRAQLQEQVPLTVTEIKRAMKQEIVLAATITTSDSKKLVYDLSNKMFIVMHGSKLVIPTESIEAAVEGYNSTELN